MQATKSINNSNDEVIDILIKFVLTFISPIYFSKMHHRYLHDKL